MRAGPQTNAVLKVKTAVPRDVKPEDVDAMILKVTHAHTPTHAYEHVYKYTHTPESGYIQTHADTICARKCTHKHARTSMHIRALSHTHARAHTHTLAS